MGRKRKGKRKSTSEARKETQAANEEAYQKCPHSFVFQRGKVGRNVGILVRDMKRVMQPYTASSLKVRSRNVLQDFVNVAGPLNISHFIIFTKTTESNYMKVLRLPRGPTLTFKINSYSLCKDVISSIKRHNMEQKQFQHHPLLVMNGFSGDGMHYKLMTTMFQNLFPSINVNKVKLSEIRRCVILNYNADAHCIEFRQYNIKAVPVGMSKGVKKLIKARIPNMARYEDVSELLLKGGDLSESEAELDGPHNEVLLPQNLASRGNIKSSKSAIRLTEIGPRLTLELIKIEDSVCQGEVLYHSLVHKTDDEKKLLQRKRHKKRKLKEKRKQEQEENIKKKQSKKEDLKEKCLAGMKKSEPEFEEVGENGVSPSSKNIMREDSSDDDISYFRQEVGEEPDPEMFPQRAGQRKRAASSSKSAPPNKRRKDLGTAAPNKGDKSSKNKPLTEMDRIRLRKQRKIKKMTKKTNRGKRAGHAKSLGTKHASHQGNKPKNQNKSVTKPAASSRPAVNKQKGAPNTQKNNRTSFSKQKRKR